MVVVTWILAILDVPALSVCLLGNAVGAIARNHRGTLQQHARDLGTIADRAALVVDRPAARRTGTRRRLERLVLELGAHESLGGIFDQQHGWCYRPQADTRSDAGVALHGQADATAHYRNVHFGTRDEAQIGVAGPLR